MKCGSIAASLRNHMPPYGKHKESNMVFSCFPCAVSTACLYMKEYRKLVPKLNVPNGIISNKAVFHVVSLSGCSNLLCISASEVDGCFRLANLSAKSDCVHCL